MPGKGHLDGKEEVGVTQGLPTSQTHTRLADCGRAGRQSYKRRHQILPSTDAATRTTRPQSTSLSAL